MTVDLACKLSIVCPLREAEEVLPRFHSELVAALAALPPGCSTEIIYVDDGSRDSTLEELRRMAAIDPCIQYLSFSRGFGQPAALTAGLEHARGDLAITLDPRMEHPPALIPVLLGRWREGYDVVLTEPASHSPVAAAGSDYRLLSRSAIDSLQQLPETHRHLGGLVQWIGFRTTTVTLPPGPKTAGGGSVRHGLARAVEEMLSFSKVPLRASLVLGLVAALLGMAQAACCAMQLWRRTPGLAWAQEVLLMTVLLGGGFILGMLGVLGEYVGRVYEQVKGRPLYLVKEASPPAARRSLRLHPPSWWSI